MKFAWQRPVPQFGGGGGGGGKTKMTKAPNITPSPVTDPWANNGMFGPIQQAASQFFPPAAQGQIPGNMPQAGPNYMNMQQLYGQGGPMQGIGAAIAGQPQQFQAPAVNQFGQFFLKGVQ